MDQNLRFSHAGWWVIKGRKIFCHMTKEQLMCHIIKTKRIELEGGDSGPGKERKINNM